MRIILLIVLVFISFQGYSQIENNSPSSDAKYLEDQFYFGLTYNFVLNKPEDVSQRNLAYGLQLGFIKDIPVNQDRTIGLGIGLGYGVYSYNTNLLAEETADGFSYRIPDEDENLRRNKIETHMIELPIEFRWRNSTSTSYKFWRVYGGLKLGYVFGARSKAVFEEFSDSFYNRDVTNFQYGLTFNLGYNTFNVHFYYALNDLLDDARTDTGESIDFSTLRVGLIFYIL